MSEDEKPPEVPPELPKPPAGKENLKRPHGLKMDGATYEKLAAHYLHMPKRSARALSRECGVSLETAIRAVRRGWPSAGWQPLQDRAVWFDAQKAKQEAERAAVPPLTPSQVIDVQRFLDIREKNLNAAGALRAIAGRLLDRVVEATATATATRQGKRTRVIDVVRRGKVVGQRTVQEDVTLPPYLPHLAQAASDLGRLIFTAGQSEKEWSRVIPPEGAPQQGKGWDGLDDAQLAEVVSTGRLPEGVTHEMLFGPRARPGK